MTNYERERLSTLPFPTSEQVLSGADRSRLQVWKDNYALETAGFTPGQARRLLFTRWRRVMRAWEER